MMVVEGQEVVVSPVTGDMLILYSNKITTTNTNKQTPKYIVGCQFFHIHLIKVSAKGLKNNI